MRTHLFSSLAIVFSVSFFLSGCGGGPELGSVEGTVTLKGQPLKEGTIGFVPAKGRPAFGKIVDGKILEVTTTTSGDGVALGPCKVQIQPVAPKDMYAKVEKSDIQLKYQSAEKSGFTADIQTGVNKVSFELK